VFTALDVVPQLPAFAVDPRAPAALHFARPLDVLSLPVEIEALLTEPAGRLLGSTVGKLVFKLCICRPDPVPITFANFARQLDIPQPAQTGGTLGAHSSRWTLGVLASYLVLQLLIGAPEPRTGATADATGKFAIFKLLHARKTVTVQPTGLFTSLPC